MDDLTRITGIGKATATKLVATGYDSLTKLAAATTAEDLAKLQDAGFAIGEIDKWVLAAAALVKDASQADQSGGTDAGNAGPAALLQDVVEMMSQQPSPTLPVVPEGMQVDFTSQLIALQEIRHLGVTYVPGEKLPATVDAEEAAYLEDIGAAEPA